MDMPGVLCTQKQTGIHDSCFLKKICIEKNNIRVSVHLWCAPHPQNINFPIFVLIENARPTC